MYTFIHGSKVVVAKNNVEPTYHHGRLITVKRSETLTPGEYPL